MSMQPASRRQCITVLLTALLTFSATGCAHREPRPEPTPEPWIRTLSMVPVVPRTILDEPDNYVVARSGGVVVAPVFIGHVPTRRIGPGHGAPGRGGGGRHSGAHLGAAVGVGVAGALIGLAIHHHATQRQQEFDAAINKIGFFAVPQLHTRIIERLAEAGVTIQPLPSGESYEMLRTRKREDFSKVEFDTDAVLDIRVEQEGYYHSYRAGGYTPMLGVTVILWPADRAKRPEYFSYYADFRLSPSNPRWFTTPVEMTYASLEDLTNNAETAKVQWEALMEMVLAKITEDIGLRMLKPPAQPQKTVSTQP
jgi:hypothetical protein